QRQWTGSILPQAQQLCSAPGKERTGLGHEAGALGIARPLVRSENADNRHAHRPFMLPRMPRTMALPSLLATVRAKEFIAASAGVCRLDVRRGWAARSLRACS